MDNPLKGRDFLTLANLSSEELTYLLDVASAQKTASARGFHPRLLEGKAVALIFMKPSMRTRVSFEVGVHQLGAQPVVLGGNDTVFSRGESVKDSVKVLERYVDCICIRTFEQSLVEEIADHASVPVVNMLTDAHHPCQGLADLLTIKERFGELAGLNFTYLGDGNNMAHTYLLAGALTGMNVNVASPTGFEPSAEVVAQARLLAAESGAQLRVMCDPAEAVAGANVICTDTWASMGQEDEQAKRAVIFAPYTVDEGLMAAAAPDAVFMHCLPAHRGLEVTDGVMDAPCSVVYDEAENRLHAQKALLSLLLG